MPETTVVEFIDKYVESQKDFDTIREAAMRAEWDGMPKFVKAHFESGFSKKSGHSRTPRIRFEALSVGTALALRSRPELVPGGMDWLESEEFKAHMRSDASNSKPKLEARIHFVRDHLLGVAK